MRLAGLSWWQHARSAIEKVLDNGIITIIFHSRVTDWLNDWMTWLFLLILSQSVSKCRLFANVANENVLHSVDKSRALSAQSNDVNLIDIFSPQHYNYCLYSCLCNYCYYSDYFNYGDYCVYLLPLTELHFITFFTLIRIHRIAALNEVFLFLGFFLPCYSSQSSNALNEEQDCIPTHHMYV